MNNRFWSHVDKSGDCWIWTGRRDPCGYGRYHTGSEHLAHRLSWTWCRGLIPDKMYVLHRCDNPPCVNPEHLFIGTQSDNMIDGITKGRVRLPPQDGEQNHQAKLTAALVEKIRVRYAAGGVLQRQLAVEYGLTSVSAILTGDEWPTAPGPLKKKRVVYRPGRAVRSWYRANA